MQDHRSSSSHGHSSSSKVKVTREMYESFTLEQKKKYKEEYERNKKKQAKMQQVTHFSFV